MWDTVMQRNPFCHERKSGPPQLLSSKSNSAKSSVNESRTVHLGVWFALVEQVDEEGGRGLGKQDQPALQPALCQAPPPLQAPPHAGPAPRRPRPLASMSSSLDVYSETTTLSPSVKRVRLTCSLPVAAL